MGRGFRINPMPMRWGKLYKGTPAELALEGAVAALGVPYRTQFPGYLYGSRYFPDFVLPTLQIVIEVDDDSHNKTDKMLDDVERSEKLEAKFEWTVVRCTNEEATNDPYGTVKRLLMDQGYYPIPEGIRSLKIADFLPQPEKCPPKDKKADPAKARAKKRVKLAKTRARRRGFVYLPKEE